MAQGKIANVVRRHAVQPADAVAAGDCNFGAPAQVIKTTACEQGLELGASIAEVGGGGRVVRTRVRPGKCRRSHRLNV